MCICCVYDILLWRYAFNIPFFSKYLYFHLCLFLLLDWTFEDNSLLLLVSVSLIVPSIQKNLCSLAKLERNKWGIPFLDIIIFPGSQFLESFSNSSRSHITSKHQLHPLLVPSLLSHHHPSHLLQKAKLMVLVSLTHTPLCSFTEVFEDHLTVDPASSYSLIPPSRNLNHFSLLGVTQFPVKTHMHAIYL